MSNLHNFWIGFEKTAANPVGVFGRIGKALKSTVEKPTVTAGIPKVKPTPAQGNVIDYAKMRTDELAKKRPAQPAVLNYSGGNVKYTPPGATAPKQTNPNAYQAKAKEQSQKQLQNSLKSTHTEGQYRRAMG